MAKITSSNTGRINIDKFDKKALASKFAQKSAEYKKEIKEKDIKIAELESKIRSIKAEIQISRTDEDTKKKILSYYAKGFQYGIILDKLKFNNYEITIEAIRDICMNVDDLESELILYYKKEVKAYEESININSNILQNDLIRIYDILINDAMIDLKNAQTLQDKNKLREEIRGHTDKKNNVLRTIVVKEEEIADSEIQDIKNSIRQRNDKILKNFDTSHLRIVK